MATISDISKKTGVSVSAVSLALNNKPGVSEKTVVLVRKTAEELGYVFKKQKGRNEILGSIGFIKVIMHGHVLNENHQSFIADYIDGVEHTNAQNDYKTEVMAIEKEALSGLLTRIKKNKLAGVIILATEMTPEDISPFSESAFPSVFMDACYDTLPFDFVDMNNVGALHQIIAHLKDAGHREIGFLQGRFETPNFKRRWETFLQALEYHQISLNPDHFYVADSIPENAREQLNKIFSSNRKKLPRALFCVNDILALSAIRSLNELGVSVPEDVSIIGFDNLSLGEYSMPPLSSYEVSKKEIGKKAAQLLIDRIKDPDKPLEKIRIDGSLIERSSVRNILA